MITKYEKNLNSDVYLISFVKNGILINDEYSGVAILEDDLSDIKKYIRIHDDIMIREMYVNKNGEEAVLYCDEDSCFIHVNIKYNNIKYIKIPNEMKRVVFGNEYYWDDNELYVFYEDYKWCILDLKEGLLVSDRKGISANIDDVLLKDIDVDKYVSYEMSHSYHNDMFKNNVLISMSEKFMEIILAKRYRIDSMGEFITADVTKKNNGVYLAVLDDVYGKGELIRSIKTYVFDDGLHNDFIR